MTRPFRDRLANRYAAWAARKAPPSHGLACRPEPLSLGEFSKAKQLLAGQISFGGEMVLAPGRSLWQITPPSRDFAEAAHGFGWLDDLVALGGSAPRALAQTWTKEWLARYGRIKAFGNAEGAEAAWQPQVTGRRISRLLHHFAFVTYGLPPEERNGLVQEILASLSRQAAYLSRRAASAPAGLPRFEAYLGELYAGLMLEDMGDHTEKALAGLVAEAETQINASGAMASRNPERLAEALLVLGWAAQGLSDLGQTPPEPILAALDRAAVELRVLRHADGALPRMHGSMGGHEMRLDQALTFSAARPKAGPIHSAMGYLRLHGGRTSLIIDAESPPSGSHAASAHASTCAIELTSGRRPLLVSCGSGRAFGPDWHKAGRATQSHSALSLDGLSSSRFGRGKEAEKLAHRAKIIALETSQGDGAFAVVGHDGYSASHGLTTAREVQLSFDGRRLNGWDTLIAHTAAEQAQLSRHLKKAGPIDFTIHFHLHPEVQATLDPGGSTVLLELASGEVWVFRHDGQARLQLLPSAYLQEGQEKPRACRQITLSAQVNAYETRIGWTLAKSHDTALAIRDLDHDDPLPI